METLKDTEIGFQSVDVLPDVIYLFIYLNTLVNIHIANPKFVKYRIDLWFGSARPSSKFT